MTWPDAEVRRFIQQNLRLVTPRDLPELKVHRAHPASRLKRLTGEDAAPPYWAYGWAGGTVLVRFILDHPETVMGKHALDIGTGGGVVAIAAAMAGAKTVIGIDSDPLAIVTARLNAAANGVEIELKAGDGFGDDIPDVDLILGGDVFYAPELAERAVTYFTACVTAGREVLIGDPGRTDLALRHLEPLKSYTVEDFGHILGTEPPLSTVYRFRAA